MVPKAASVVFVSGIPKVRMIQEIEELRPELQADVLMNLKCLVDGKIPLLEAGSAEGVAAQIAEGRIGRRQS